eukprot:jgi/Ulvmu1/9875/UM057_0030.1
MPARAWMCGRCGLGHLLRALHSFDVFFRAAFCHCNEVCIRNHLWQPAVPTGRWQTCGCLEVLISRGSSLAAACCTVIDLGLNSAEATEQARDKPSQGPSLAAVSPATRSSLHAHGSQGSTQHLHTPLPPTDMPWHLAPPTEVVYACMYCV